MGSEMDSSTYHPGDIAIVGMATHVPGAKDINAFWHNLASGTESIRRLSEKQLRDASEPLHKIKHPNYVPSAAILEGYDMFDGEFFGLSPKESAIMDPQHRLFLECSWEAMENAGHPPETVDGQVGVYAGCGMGSYFYFNICANPDLVEETGMFLLRHTGNDKDFLTTRLSHVLDLKGPSVNVQTACSTSLVATHYACQALQNGECDMALAGGVTIELPHGRGYVFQEGEILSPDGHCHAFDHRAQGTVFGSGVGVVVLRRLEDAIADGDHIWAVIKGTAINNDGADKAGYLAPSVEGQATAIAEAHALAGVTADTIDYVECHGTGTYLGDPIEVAALTSAFHETTDNTGYCRIGSVKTNIGHLDTAAGAASLIKTSLSLHHKKMAPSLGFESPNPAIDFENSPFLVNDKLTEWVSQSGPRRAGVNSLGVGGTNAHVVLEEAPEAAASDESDWPFQLLTLSARTTTALDDAALNLAEYLENNPEVPLADIAWTLKQGRRSFDKRRVLVAENHQDAAAILRDPDSRQVYSHSRVSDRPKTVFMFPGGGAQYANMARDLYETEPTFADWMDQGLEILQSKIDYDIRALWLPEKGMESEANQQLRKPSVQLPLIMITEYALAKLWMDWGVEPKALIGHSMGENTAACLAGVMSFEDCIGLVHLRGTLFDSVPSGGMLSVPISANDLKPYLGEELDLAAENGPFLSVASGPRDKLKKLKQRLAEDRIDSQDIPIDIAAHSRMLEPILGDFHAYLQSIDLKAPEIPFISNRTGNWIKDTEATDPEYWVAHLRNAVMFAEGITTLAQDPDRVFLEVGPGKALSSLTQTHPEVSANQVVHTLRHEKDEISDDSYFVAMLGRMWAVGVDFDWTQIWGEARRNRVPLPTYPFQRSRYFIEPGEASSQQNWGHPPMRQPKIEDWGYRPAWRPKSADCPVDVEVDLNDAHKEVWLVFLDDTGIGSEVVRTLRKAGQKVVTVQQGDAFARKGDQNYVLSPERGRDEYDQLIISLMARGLAPTRFAHLWLLTNRETFRPGSSFFHRNIEQGFYSLLFLSQAIEDASLPKPVHLVCVTSDSHKLRDEPLRYPEKSLVAGPLRVIPRELVNFTCGHLDVVLPGREAKLSEPERNTYVQTIIEDLLSVPSNYTAAIRNGKRFELTWRKAPLNQKDAEPALPKKGTVLITGGFGGIGLSLARHLAERQQANIALLSREGLPERKDWSAYLEANAPNDRTARRIRSVQEIETLGGSVLPLAVDTANLEDMQATVEKVNNEFGRINMVIHAAGIIDDAPLLARKAHEAEAVLTPKLHGTQVLSELFADGEVDDLVLFSSTSTATAPSGQVDYVAANEFLNAYAKSREGGKTKVTSLSWGIWADTGMAVEANTTNEFDPTSVPETEPVSPLLDRAHFDRKGNRVFLSEFSPSSDWVFDEHRTRDGKALMPGTGYIELAADALREQHEPFGYEIQNLYFLSPFHIADQDNRTMRLKLERSTKGYSAQVLSTSEFSDGAEWNVHCESEIALSSLPTPKPLDLTRISERLNSPLRVENGTYLVSAQEPLLSFGPRWKTLVSQCVNGVEGLAELRLNPSAQEDGDCIAHPALLDIATGWAMELIPGYTQDHLWVPMTYRSIRVYAPLPNRVFSWVRLSPGQTDYSNLASFDITLSDENGNILIDISGFEIQKQADADFLNETVLNDAPTVTDLAAVSKSNSPAQGRLRHALSQGIQTENGTVAFDRALASGLTQITVSSMDLNELIENTTLESLETRTSVTHSFERPQLDTSYAEPSNDIEKTLAGFWQDLLGVQQIGIDDNFFDLGGHSLIAVRLFSQIRKTYGVDLPISVLFEAPTIRACADLLIARAGGAETSVETASSAPKPDRRFTHLVPMHEGEGGPRTPFFLVAGMFGNVLNLRHLAHLLGHNRPFYGLQARGLFGDDEPHHTIEAAAKDYIAEMRSVQPSGPYIIGGFSGGGLIAYEIAHQLKELGEETALLVLLDTPLPQRRALKIQDRVLIQLQNIQRAGLRYPIEWVKNRIAWEIQKRRKAAALEKEEPQHQFHNAAIEAAFLGAISQFTPKPWNGPTCLFRPPLKGNWTVSGGALVSHERAYVTNDNDWGDKLPSLQVIEVPGNHDSMVLEPNVRVMAARLRNEIEQAERDIALSAPSLLERAAE